MFPEGMTQDTRWKSFLLKLLVTYIHPLDFPGTVYNMWRKAKFDKPGFQALLCRFLVMGIRINCFNFLNLNFLLVKWNQQ